MSRSAVWRLLLSALALSSPARASLVDRWGPSVQVGLPAPMSAGLEVRVNRFLSAAITGSVISLPVKIDSITATDRAFDARVRYHPFGGAFFVGLALGELFLAGERTDNIELDLLGASHSVPVTARTEVRSFYLSPHLGWIWSFSFGLFVGLEAGWQLPIASGSTLIASSSNALGQTLLEGVKQTDAYRKLETDVTDLGDQIGRMSLPCFTLLRLGWYF